MRAMSTTASASKRFSVWLALLAMVLVVCAPGVSQFVAAMHARAPVADVCSATTPDARHSPHAPATLSACGYCDLLATHSFLPGATGAPTFWRPLLLLLTDHRADDTVLPGVALLSGSPRAPPPSV